MFIVKVKHNAKDTVHNKIRKLKGIERVEKVKGTDLLILFIDPKIKVPDIGFMESLILNLSDDIIDVNAACPNTAKNGKDDENKVFKFCFFDIDKTLTFRSTRFFDKDVDDIFDKLRANGITVHFASGRALHDIRTANREYELDPPYSIAENGGIVTVGNGIADYDPIGKIGNPQKFFEYIRNNGLRHAKLDPMQMGRHTEIVILRESVSKRDLLRLQKLAKKEKNIDVTILESPRAYHITQKDIDKAAGINYIIKLYSKDVRKNHEVISAGDSELDFPMFKRSNRKFLMGNAEKHVKKTAPKGVKILRGEYVDCLQQIVNELTIN